MNQVQALAWYTRAAKGQQGLKEAAACAQRLSDSLEHSKRARLQPQVMLYQQATTLRTSLCFSSAPRKLSIGQLEFEMCILDTHQLDIFCLPIVNWLGVGGVHVSTLVGRKCGPREERVLGWVGRGGGRGRRKTTACQTSKNQNCIDTTWACETCQQPSIFAITIGVPCCLTSMWCRRA